jgi:hypothetical protein
MRGAFSHSQRYLTECELSVISKAQPVFPINPAGLVNSWGVQSGV